MKFLTGVEDDEARAFVATDATIYDDTGRLLDINQATFDQVEYAQIIWRFQKNGENGEGIKYYKDTENPRWCPCRAIWNILRRAIRLSIPAREPLAKYKDDKGKCFFITDKDVKRTLQAAATKVLGITDKKVLSRWTCHSMRVTAANELHRLGFSDMFIKHRLRWKSNAFLDYLRHTIHIARNHTKAMSLGKKNLTFESSNLDTVNKKMKKVKVFRAPGPDDLLFEQHFNAAAA